MVAITEFLDCTGDSSNLSRRLWQQTDRPPPLMDSGFPQSFLVLKQYRVRWPRGVSKSASRKEQGSIIGISTRTPLMNYIWPHHCNCFISHYVSNQCLYCSNLFPVLDLTNIINTVFILLSTPRSKSIYLLSIIPSINSAKYFPSTLLL